MNKLVIPAILAATVLVAATFALMPVEKASTVHSGLASGATSIIRDNNCVTGADLPSIPNDNSVILYDLRGSGKTIDAEITARLGNADVIVQTITAAGVVWNTQALAAFPVDAKGTNHVDVNDVAGIRLLDNNAGDAAAEALANTDYICITVHST